MPKELFGSLLLLFPFITKTNKPKQKQQGESCKTYEALDQKQLGGLQRGQEDADTTFSTSSNAEMCVLTDKSNSRDVS